MLNFDAVIATIRERKVVDSLTVDALCNALTAAINGLERIATTQDQKDFKEAYETLCRIARNLKELA